MEDGVRQFFVVLESSSAENNIVRLGYLPYDKVSVAEDMFADITVRYSKSPIIGNFNVNTCIRNIRVLNMCQTMEQQVMHNLHISRILLLNTHCF